MEYPVLKGLKLTAVGMPRRKVVSDRVRRFDEKQQAELARSRRKVEYCKKQGSLRSTPVSFRKNTDEERNRAGSNSKVSEAGSPRKEKRKFTKTN